MPTRPREHSASRSARSVWRNSLLRGLLLVLAIGAAPGQALAQHFNAHIDRTQIAEGESVTLRLSASGDTQGSPDLGPLSGDFDILSQSQGTQLNIINGRSSSTREWQLVLLPRRSGELTIPALRLDGLTSRPLQLEVLPAAASQPGAMAAGQPVVLETEADPQQPYVQGEVSYRVRILSRVPLREASLSEPRAGDAIIERLGDDSRYTTQRNGESYQVIERRYVIFPQHSGTLNIEGPVLRAAVPVQGSSRQALGGRFPGGDAFRDIEKFLGHNPFAGFPAMGSLFEETRPVQMRGRNVTLEVQPRPAGSQGPWLPAKNLTLSETWSPDPPVFRVGEPVTRSVEVVAEGLSAAQLPELTTPVPAGVKSYPDQPQSETRPQGDHLVATRTMKAALIPTASGTLTLPELQVPWWDTETQQPRVATLPARTIEVLPAGPGANSRPPSAAAAEPAPSAAPAHPNHSASTSAAVAGGTEIQQANWHGSPYWRWLAGLATAGWLVTGILWLRARSGKHVDSSKLRAAARTAPARQQLAQSTRQLKSACLSDDPKAARAALLDWAGARWPDSRPRGLSQLAERLANAQARAELITLDRLLYDAGDGQAWDGRHAWPILHETLKDASSDGDQQKAESLPNLYPQTG